MKRAGPVLTLLAVAAVGGGMLLTNIVTGGGSDSAPADNAGPANTVTVPTTAIPATTTPTASATPFPAQADYVTTIATEGRPLTLSVTVSGDRSVAYVCDGASVESWLRGDAAAGRTELSGKESRIEAALLDGALTGLLTMGERSWEFTAPAVRDPAGIYIDRGAGARDSWVVAPDGSVTGVRRNADGTTSPAPGLAPDARKVTGDDDDF
ncbi:Uncharacterised protein [Nocardia otitidiscaviarum]|uniref:Uncharacterized protein n=1 Tax=Nocardia otitidiscaviarum TaxID=1823 RepID=A0A379JGT8_9NOCA|nr:hypothetical protein [Nocardia otitidiscaviarum]SUD47680.1 Uncharacterised protein [Nocardia otitidiscaviarum]